MVSSSSKGAFHVCAQACSLQCAGNGLSFLFAPIVTLATEWGRQRRCPSAASAGVLNVVETRIRVQRFPHCMRP